MRPISPEYWKQQDPTEATKKLQELMNVEENEFFRIIRKLWFEL